MFLLQQNTHRMLIQHDADVGHRFVPSLRARLPNENGGYTVVTNSSGFRSDIEFEQAKRAKPRILMFGDSYTAGDNVCNADRYSDILSQNTNTEVYNYGVSGTGTDQNLLIARKFASDVEADLAVICVYIDSFHRIQVSYRPAIDRVTGKRVLVPKPWFELTENGLELRQVPVPIERKPDLRGDKSSNGKRNDEWLDRLHSWYSGIPVLQQLRESSLLSEPASRLITEVRRVRGQHPYPDILSEETPGWKLMRAILEQFVQELSPMPVVIFPIPTPDFYEVGMKPVYQPLFELLDDPERGVHVGDVSTDLISRSYDERSGFAHRVGGHFTRTANKIVADSMERFLKERDLLAINDIRSTTTPRCTSPQPTPTPEIKYVLGISAFYHNSAAAILRDGQIIAAAEEERFTRVKNDRRFPINAINFCLEEAGIEQQQLTAVAFYDDSALTLERILQSLMAVDRSDAREMWDTIIPEWACNKLHFPRLVREHLKYEGPVLQGNHHRSHAASCFYPSPFESAAIMTIDGVGEWATATIGRGSGNQIEILKEMHFPNSLGLLYSAFTYFTGFKVNSGEYKMMGLAPYGRPIYADRIKKEIVDIKKDGSIQLNMDYFAFLYSTRTTSGKFDELFDGPRRQTDSRITRREIDIARSIQEVTEEVLLKMARHAREVTGENRLCLAGGVALNCVANGELLREKVFDDLWIQPAAGDSGCALGVALDVWHTYFDEPRDSVQEFSSQGGSYLGPAFSPNEIQAFLETHGYPYRRLKPDERSRYLSQQIDQGKVVGHFADRLEFGPRSLGARSIVGDARNTDMQVKLNLQIKYRESFRPFAPAVLRERVSDYFEIDCDSPYMLLVAPVKEDRRLPFNLEELENIEDLLPIVRQPRSDLPAITHVDYSARVQTIRKEHHPVFYDLVKQFEQDTGCGVVVNTSFNVRGEPIVCTPFDAYRCFMRTEMDVLALGDFILTKEKQPKWPEGRGEGLESEDIIVAKPRHITKQIGEKFGKIFDQHFWPIAEQIRKEGALAIQVKAASQDTTWQTANQPNDWQKVFEFDKELDAEIPNPNEFAKAICDRWQHRKAAQDLTKTVAKLLKVGLANLTLDESEELPESVYVMF